MPLSYKELEGPAAEPVTLAQAKLQCVVDGSNTTDDSLITGLISAARVYCEKKANRCFFERPMQLSLDYFPYPNFGSTVGGHRKFPFFTRYWEELAIHLPKPSAVSITSITYLDQTGTPQTLDPSTYTLDANSEPGRIFPTSLLYWPWCENFMPGNVIVKWVAGTYGDGVEVNNCPATVVQAMLLLISYWYNHRDGAESNPPKGIEMGVDALLLGEIHDSFGFGGE